jgi:hypothetical protein
MDSVKRCCCQINMQSLIVGAKYLGKDEPMRMILAASVFVFLNVGFAAAGDPLCQGSSCLNIYNVRVGTRCNTPDSIEADYANDSGSQFLRGYVIFDTPKGKVYVSTDILKPGQKKIGVAFVCHGTGTPTGIANTGSDKDTLKYPPKQ